MGHGGYGKGKGKVAISHRPKSLGVEKNQRKPKSVAVKNQKKPKSVTMKNQIRSTERMLLRKSLPPEVREAQENKLRELKKQQDVQTRLAVERKIFLRYRKIKFFERRKVERAIRRLEKLQRTSSDHTRDADITDQLSKLKEDLEYVRFFPKTEKYVSLFNGAEDAEIVDKRNKLRKQIKANIVAAAASGKDLEETGSEDDGLLDMSEDDFFLNGSSSDEVDADDEWTDKSTREQASSASGKATSGMSSDDKNQRQMSARALMPPPRPSKNSFRPANRAQTWIGSSSSKKAPIERDQLSMPRNTSYNRSGSSARNQGSSNAPVERVQLSMPKNTSYNRSGSSARNQRSSNAPIERIQLSTSSNTSYSRSSSSARNQGSSNARTGHSSNISSNSDAHKPKRKRRPKKKKQQS